MYKVMARGKDWETVEQENNQVVKRFPPGTPIATLEEEASFTRLAKDVGMDAPFVHGIIEGDRPGIVFDKVHGPTYLDWMLQHLTQFDKLSRYFAYVQHEANAHRLPELPSVKVKLERRIRSCPDLDEGQKVRILGQLVELPDKDWVCHGNYRPEYVIVGLDGPILLNWEDMSRGDYLADVARTSLLMDLGPLTEGMNEEDRETADKLWETFHRTYLMEYVKICGRMDEELEAWKLPVAVARLAEAVPGEKEILLAIIQDLM